MHPFPLPLPRPRNEDQRLYAQAYRCLLAASWQRAIFRCIDPENGERIICAESVVKRAYAALTYADELVEGAVVYLQLRADLRERAPS